MGFNIPRNQKLRDNNDEENFHELFVGNIIYEIPLFQRDYKWNHKLLKPLINDFDEIYDGIKNVHFLERSLFMKLGEVNLLPIEILKL